MAVMVPLPTKGCFITAALTSPGLPERSTLDVTLAGAAAASEEASSLGGLQASHVAFTQADAAAPPARYAPPQ